jgi:type IV pilus assembly protein PilY1
MNKRNGLDVIISVYKALKAIGKQWSWVFCGGLIIFLSCPDIYADPSQIPLSLTTSGQPNLLVILDNSNSMDEGSGGGAAGSNCPTSKSEIARSVIKNMINSYTGVINMGLMTYQLSSVSNRFIHNSEYDVSYNPANYTPGIINNRSSSLKSYRIPNPTSTNDFIYYNYESPYYDSQNQGYGFCYSLTANAAANTNHPNGFNNGENPISGPWDNYRCFRKKTGSSDQLPTWGNSASETAQGYSLFNFQSSFQSTDSDTAAGIVDFGKQLAWSFVGSAYYSSSSPGLGFLQTPIKSLTTAQGNTIQSLLACNVPQQSPYTPAVCTQNAACTTAGIKNAGNTPIQGTLQTANKYFAGTLSNAPQGYTASSYPLPLSCGKNYVILVTDGLPDTDSTGKIVVDPNGVAPGTTATAAAATEAAALLSSGVKTYVVGFGSAAQSAPLDAIAAAGGTGVSYSASDYPSLVSALDSILQSILSSSNSAAAVAANSTQLNTGSLIYPVKYNATDWSGQLLAYSVNSSTGAIITPALWEASSLLSSNSRSIYSFNPSAAAGSGGMSFLWGNLTPTQQTYLNTLSGSNDSKGSDRVAWLSGDQSKEKAQGGSFRNRTNLLGDIIDSAPVYVGRKDYGYFSLSGAEGSSYSSFLNSSAYINRTAMLYAGANDGMLHGFNASSTGGQEVFAYIPNALYPKLSQLTSPNYVHQFYVDGISGVGDFYDTSTSTWHTLLAGATGAGGKALFALDVTDPANFSASKVLWEFSNSVQPAPAACSTWAPNTNYDVNDLGYTLGQALVVRLQDGHWVVLAANGYNSVNGHAVLFIIDAKSGCVIQKIDTVSADTSGLATVNGLSSPIAIDTNNDRSADTIYAGDLHGNFWKFDVSGSAGSYPTPTAPFFVSCTTSGSCSAANRQAITAKPTVGSAGGVGTDQNGVGWMVYLGTGQYFAPGDNVVGANPQIQSFYGLWDQGTSITDRSLLQAQTITYQGQGTLAGTSTTTTNVITIVSKNPVCYATSSTGCIASSSLKRGWLFDLNYPTLQGERVVSSPKVISNGLVKFATLIPSANQCTAGGTSNLFELNALNGGQSVMAPFDINGDGMVNSQDQILVNGVAQFVSGINLNIGIINTPNIITGTAVNYNYFNDLAPIIPPPPVTPPPPATPTPPTAPHPFTELGPDANKRSWRQLK